MRPSNASIQLKSMCTASCCWSCSSGGAYPEFCEESWASITASATWHRCCPRIAALRQPDGLKPESDLVILRHHETKAKGDKGGRCGHRSPRDATQQRRAPPTLGSPPTSRPVRAVSCAASARHLPASSGP